MTSEPHNDIQNTCNPLPEKRNWKMFLGFSIILLLFKNRLTGSPLTTPLPFCISLTWHKFAKRYPRLKGGSSWQSSIIVGAESLFIFIWQKRGSTSQKKKSNDVLVLQRGGPQSISRKPRNKHALLLCFYIGNSWEGLGEFDFIQMCKIVSS